MNVLVKIPMDLYHGLLGRCEVSSKEYTFLKNGVVVEVEDDGDIEVEILCQPGEAEELLEWAKIFYPEASSRITLDPDPDL